MGNPNEQHIQGKDIPVSIDQRKLCKINHVIQCFQNKYTEKELDRIVQEHQAVKEREKIEEAKRKVFLDKKRQDYSQTFNRIQQKKCQEKQVAQAALDDLKVKFMMKGVKEGNQAN